MALHQEIENLTLELVRIPSLNNSVGEKLIVESIAGYFRGLDYFKEHADYVWEVPLKNDPYGRKNVFAFVKGENGHHADTVVLHGHIDTVGVDDYGQLASYAFDPMVLAEKFKEITYLPADARADLESGDWLFGRGVSDMKGGVAVHMVVLKEMSKQVKKLKGNILFMANPVEENQHTGIIESLPELKKLKEKEGLVYRVAINTDYFAPLYPGDTTKYIDLGAVGKLLPCFYIYGKETHAGECFQGLDPNLIAAEILRSIDINTDLCDVYEDEYSMPPAALKFADRKPSYNVQTPMATYLYFNYFTYDISIDRVVEILREKAGDAFNAVLAYSNRQHENYCRKTGLQFNPLPWTSQVLSFEELYREVREEVGPGLDDHVKKMAEDMAAKAIDTRDICLAIVEDVKRMRRDTSPVVVIFFSPPFCPHSTIKGKNDHEKEILRLIREAVGETAADSGEKFGVRKFFPCLSDSSYIKMDDDDRSLAALINNFPQWDVIYPVPVQQIREADIPAANFGVCGKDAHKWTERLYKPYTFHVLPQLIMKMVEKVILK